MLWTWFCGGVFMHSVYNSLLIHSSVHSKQCHYRLRGPLAETLIFVHDISKPRGFGNLSPSILVVHWVVILEDTHKGRLCHTVVMTNGEVVGTQMTRLWISPSHFVSCVSVQIDTNRYNHKQLKKSKELSRTSSFKLKLSSKQSDLFSKWSTRSIHLFSVFC